MKRGKNNVKEMRKKTSKEGICQLCGCQSELCDAHIIPKALKHLVAGRGGTFGALAIVPKNEFSFASKVITSYHTQNLDSDKNILCSDCDNNILGIYDKSLVNFYKNYIKLSNLHIITKNISIDTEKRLYLGFLAILYRASIAQKQYVYMPENYKELLRFSLFDGTLEYISDDIRIYLQGHHCDFSSNSIYNIFGCYSKDGQYLYCFPSFGLEVIFLLGNINETEFSNTLKLGCLFGKIALLNPNQDYVNIPLSPTPSQLTQIVSSIERPLP